ncbi:HNH endonuclease [Rhizobium pusense]|uniref:HNH endonuclease n=1 Tax=Agrobacterium pusense TaxID=648995 RepID=UPI00244B8F36|nr:HNH endonuclease [Agrobacterium pusense]MDH2092648.1 HNH endonuclease [Agrobacterium pusense]
MPRKPKTPDGISQQFIEKIAAEYVGNQCLYWPFGTGSDGYGLINKDGKKVRVSRLICEIENGPAPSEDMDAAHSCGNGHLGCIARKHLRWATRKENVDDAKRHGTILVGEASKQAKLTADAVREIRRLRGIIKVTELARRYGVTTTVISSAQFGDTWASVKDVPPVKRGSR